MRPRQALQVLEMIRDSHVSPLKRQGVVLHDDDNQTVYDVYQQWLLLMLDLDYLHPDTFERVSQRLWSDLLQADVFTLNDAMAECLQRVRLQSFKGFKVLCKRISTHLYSLIKDDVDACSQGDVYAAKRLMQAFAFTSRLSLNKIDLTQQCLDDYLETERNFPDSYPKHIIQYLNSIVKRWFGPFVPGDLIPGHGSGGVAGHGRTSLEVKYRDLTSDDRLAYAFSDVKPDLSGLHPFGIRSTLDRISQTIFVPKSYKTFRTISMEPSTLMYYQQGVWRGIDRQVAANPYLKARLGFHDQERNKRKAAKGSIDRDYATIDLSAASDSVSYELVKKVFRGTWLLRYIVATRSTKTLLPDGRVVSLKKFAPMGSRLCFPIETIIFSAICEFVTRERSFNGDYSVFGDDIIVPTQCVEDTMLILETLGFRVNRSKSFYQHDCWFRESCGGEYVDGFDVTPLRVSRKYASTERYERLEQLIELSNNAYDYGFRNLRDFYICKLRDFKFTPLFSPEALKADNYTNYHARRRWNEDLQRIEVEANCLLPEYVNPFDPYFQDEFIRYHHWLVTTVGRTSFEFGFQSVVCKPTPSIRTSWQPKAYESLDQDFIDYCYQLKD